MENNTTTIKKERFMTKQINVNRKITKIMLGLTGLILIGLGAFYGFWASVEYTEARITQLIQSDNVEVTMTPVKK